jgi:hypothetical protein
MGQAPVGRRSPPFPFVIAVVGYAMYQTAAAMSARIAMHNIISITNRCIASRDVIAFHSSMFGSPTGVFAGDCTEI